MTNLAIVLGIVIWLLIGFLGHLYWWNKAWGIDKQGINVSLVSAPLGIFAFYLGWYCYSIWG